MSTAITRTTAEPGNSIIGATEARFPVSGRIRPGVKVLTRAATEKPGAREIYERGVAAGRSFDEIESELIKHCGFQRSPLTPKNVSYFTVRESDFSVPQIATQIMDLYAEPDEHGERRLLRFPVIFAMDDWFAVMPHGLRAFGKSGLKFWSQYSPNGERLCMTYAPIAQSDPKAKRRRAPFGGRRHALRTDLDPGGLCDPDRCPQYQNSECTLSGRFLFYVPGVAGAGLIELPTNSFYSMVHARQVLEMVSHLRGGRISGLHQGRPIFWFTKRLQEVSRIDPETGQPQRVKQWLICLEADVDMSEVFRQIEAPRGQETGALEYRPASPEALEHRPAVDDFDEGVLPAGAPDETAAPDEPPPRDEEGNDPERAAVRDLRARIAKRLEELAIDPIVFGRYGTNRWGRSWGLNLEALQAAMDELEGVTIGEAGRQYRSDVYIAIGESVEGA